MMGGVGLPMMQVNMGTGRLVAAMEHLDRIVGAFADDMGRAVAQIRSEINAEREMAMLSRWRKHSQPSRRRGSSSLPTGALFTCR